MKIIISEYQELDVKKKFIFMLLNNKNYNLVEIGDNIYFVKKRGDKKAEIRYNKNDDKNYGWCWISYSLISFLSKLTGFEEYEVQKLIGKWVEHTLQMEVKYNKTIFGNRIDLVEHTLQMEVKYNVIALVDVFKELNIPHP